MSTLNLSAAVTSLQSGTSPEITLNSWIILKEYCDQVSVFTKTSWVLAALTTSTIGLSIFSHLLGSQMPHRRRHYSTGNLILSSFYALIMTALGIHSSPLAAIAEREHVRFSKYAPLFFKDLESMEEPIKHSTLLRNLDRESKNYPVFSGWLQKKFLIIGICTAIACGITYFKMQAEKKSPEDEYPFEKRLWDYASIVLLGLASVASLCGFVYARNFSPKVT